jgi:quercetin dioxygenase-like cupin family protein
MKDIFNLLYNCNNQIIPLITIITLKEKLMNQLIIKLFAILVMVVFSNVSIAKPLKPQVTVLHSSSKSSAGEAISYPKGTPKLTIAQVIFPVGGKLPKHTHPAPLIVHIMSGEVTSERPDGKKVVYKAGDTFVEATNSPHTVTNTAKTPTIVYAVIAGAEGLGPLTVFAK